MGNSLRYSKEPSLRDEASEYTERMDRMYTRIAHIYDWALRRAPSPWTAWLDRALPHVRGPRVLEVSFGTGYLLARYAGRVEATGIDLNERMVGIARENLRRAGVDADLRRGDVAALPFRDGTFDSVVNTMSFTGYPNADGAMAEIRRVLRPGGRVVMIDVGYPGDGNWAGMSVALAFRWLGDIIRDMGGLFSRHGFAHTREEIGGLGAIQMYVAVCT